MLLEINIYTDANVNYQYPVKVTDFQKLDQLETLPFRQFTDDKYGYRISYLPLFDGENIYFLFQCDEKIYKKIGEFEIVFHFIEGPPNYVTNQFILTQKSDLVLTYDSPIVSESYPVDVIDKGILVKIPRFLKFNDNELAYNIYLREWIHLDNTPAKRSFALIIGSENIMGSFKTYWNPTILQV